MILLLPAEPRVVGLLFLSIINVGQILLGILCLDCQLWKPLTFKCFSPNILLGIIPVPGTIKPAPTPFVVVTDATLLFLSIILRWVVEPTMSWSL